MKLSKNFSLDEFLRSQTAARNGVDMTPPQYVIDNLKRLCIHVLQPLRDDLGVPFFVSSGYRPRELNELIGGSRTSAHMSGRAVDFVALGLSPLAVARRAAELELPYDQVIHEFGRWVHIGISDNPRAEQLTAHRSEGQTRYVRGLYDIGELA